MTVNVLTRFYNVEILNTDLETIPDSYAISKGYVDNKINDLVNGAPAALDTLKEIADVLGNTDNLAGTLISRISQDETNLSSEITRATNAENALTTAINTESFNRNGQFNALSNSISQEQTRAIGVENLLRSDLDTEIERATDAEDLLRVNLNLHISNYNGNAELTDMRFDTVNNRFTPVENSVTTETSRATGVEDSLRSDLNNEITNRVSAVTLVNNAVTTETSRATAAELVLSNNLAKEITDRESAVTLVNNAVTAETSRATAAENALTLNLNNEIANRETADALKVNKAGDSMSGMLVAMGGLKVSPEQNSYLYIGNHWRINVNNNGTSLIFEYNANPTENLLWATAVPFITSA